MPAQIRSKSFWTRCKLNYAACGLAIALMPSCALLQAGDHPSDYWPEMRTGKDAITVDDAAVMNAAMKNPYQYFCQDQRPIRTPRIRIRAILPNPKKGLDLDTAMSQQKYALEKIRRRVLDVYLYAVGMKGFGAGANYWGPPQRVQMTASKLSDAALETASEDVRFDPGVPIESDFYLVSANGGDPLYFASRRVFQSAGVVFNTTVYPPLKGLTDRYSLLIPKMPKIPNDELKRNFIGGGNWPSSIWTDTSWVWTRYFARYTEVEEAADPNPIFINFDVSLNMEVFCSYGRPVSDLMSR